MTDPRVRTALDPPWLSDPSEPWTIEDLERLPESANRYEIANGSLLVTPPPGLRHAVATHLLLKELLTQSPQDLEAVAVGVGFATAMSVYIPDIVVIRSASLAGEGKLLKASEILLAVEVLSPNNPRNDLVLKKKDYAEAGIPTYWIVDPKECTITTYELSKDSYREVATARPGTPLITERPFHLDIDPSRLAPS